MDKYKEGLNLEYLELNLFKDSFGPFLTLLNEYSVKYQIRQTRSGVPMAASEIVEILQVASIFPSLAAVICAYLKNKRSRKVIITTKDNIVVHAEGLSEAELSKILGHAKNLTVIETNNSQN